MANAAPLRILIIDDDAHVQKSLAFVLKMMGHEIHTATSAAQGLEQSAAQRPQLVFIDMVMPGGLGADIIADLRGLDPRLYIVAMSGSVEGGHNNLLAQARANGADETLGKPFDFDQVERLLTEVAKRRAAPG
jgi:CheY-like chemotaxis protein